MFHYRAGILTPEMTSQQQKRSDGSQKPQPGSVEVQQGRRDLYRRAKAGFSGGEQARSRKRQHATVMFWAICGRLDPAALDVLHRGGEDAYERPGTEDVEDVIRQLRELGWRFRDDVE